MATLYSVLASLQSAISAATQNLVSNSPDTNGKPLTVEVGLYWPSAKSLQNNVRPANGPGGLGPSALVTIYDLGLAADSTRWLPNVVGVDLAPVTTTVAVSESWVQQLASMTLTFGGSVSPGDSFAILLTGGLGNTQAAVFTASATDTLTSLAATAAALLNANPIIASWLTATASGSVVTLTSLLNDLPVAVSVNSANGGSQSIEIGRRKRHFQIVVWTRTPDDRITVGDPIEALIASLEYNFGPTFPDGTMGRLTYTGDTMHDEATLSDTMRRDFRICVDYGISITEATYAVLAPISQVATF